MMMSSDSSKHSDADSKLDDALDDSFPSSDPPSQSDPTHGMRSSPDELSDDAIRQRAYEIWEREGSNHGSHDEHWKQAIRELKAENSKGAT